MATTGSGNESPLKAIIFVDACGGSPSPYRTTASAQSLPLHGSPILFWQLNVLSLTGVAEALVLSSTPVSPPLPPQINLMHVTTLSNPTWRSHGDALRDVESRVALRPTDDFLLIQPGALFNLSAASLAHAHATRAEADRNWLVTITLRRGACAAPLVVATHAATSSLCLYARAPPTEPLPFDARAENIGLRDGGRVDVAADVVDVGLDVCSPDLLVEFRENFDFDSVRDYVRAKLEGGEAELLGNRMFAHFVDSSRGEYATCVDSYAAFFDASQDVFAGWMAPFVPHRVACIAGPECGKRVVTCGKAQRRISVVCGDGADGCGPEIAADADVTDVIVGRGVVIAEGAVVRRSVLGDGVRIRKGAVVEGSFLGSTVSVGPGAKVSRSLCLSGASVAGDVTIPAGCFVGDNVVFGRGGGAVAGLAPNSWVSSKGGTGQSSGKIGGAMGSDDESCESSEDESDEDSSDGSDDECSASSSAALGDGGRGALLTTRRRYDMYLLRASDDSKVDSSRGLGWPANLGSAESDTEDELEGEEGDLEEDGETGLMAGNGEGREVDLDGGLNGHGGGNLSKFYEEMEETIEHAVGEGADVDTIALEVNSLKLAYERSYSDALVALVRALTALIRKRHATSAAKKQWGAVQSDLGKWQALIARFAAGDGPAAQRSMADEIACLLRGDGKLCMYVMRVLYDADVLEEDAILGWAGEERKAVESGASSALLDATMEFIEWLEEEDEEEDSDEADE